MFLYISKELSYKRGILNIIAHGDNECIRCHGNLNSRPEPSLMETVNMLSCTVLLAWIRNTRLNISCPYVVVLKTVLISTCVQEDK